jgi:hypothetical protein
MIYILEISGHEAGVVNAKNKKKAIELFKRSYPGLKDSDYNRLKKTGRKFSL